MGPLGREWTTMVDNYGGQLRQHSKKLNFSKNAHPRVNSLPSNPCLSTKECSKILKTCHTTNFDLGFQKKNVLSRSEKVDFVESYRFLRQCHIKPCVIKYYSCVIKYYKYQICVIKYQILSNITLPEDPAFSIGVKSILIFIFKC
jgi:hypothetical protein